MTNQSGDEWLLSPGPNRPIWEPVRLVDFADERLKALHALHAKLREEAATDTMADDQLAMYAILELLFTQATVTAAAASAEITRLATLRLPKPEGRRKRRLTHERRDELILIVGQMWEVFTAHNFPLMPNPEV